MTKELLIEILKHNGNLYTVIDSLIDMNKNYFDSIQEIYASSSYIIPKHDRYTWMIGSERML